VFTRRKETRQATIEKEMLPHLDALYGYALYLTRRKEEAEDVVQETLLKAVNAFSQYQPGTNCRAWLFRILYNTFLNKVRRRAPHVEFDDTISTETLSAPESSSFARANPTPEDSFVNMLSRARVREAVEKLPPDFRAVVVLADLEELSYKEIAEILSCPIGTVMSRLHRGRKLLRARLFRWAMEMGLVDAPGGESAGSRQTGDDDLDKVTSISAYRSGRKTKHDGREDLP